MRKVIKLFNDYSKTESTYKAKYGKRSQNIKS